MRIDPHMELQFTELSTRVKRCLTEKVGIEQELGLEERMIHSIS